MLNYVLAISISLIIGVVAILMASIALKNANQKSTTTLTNVTVPATAAAPLSIDTSTGKFSLKVGSNLKVDDKGLTTVADPTFESTVTGSNFMCSDFKFINDVLYAARNFTFSWSGLSQPVPAHLNMVRVGHMVTLVIQPFQYPSTETGVIPFIGGNPIGWAPKTDVVFPVIANHNNAYVQCCLKVNTNMTIYIYGPIFSNSINTTSGGSSFPLDVCVTWTTAV